MDASSLVPIIVFDFVDEDGNIHRKEGIFDDDVFIDVDELVEEESSNESEIDESERLLPIYKPNKPKMRVLATDQLAI